MKMKNKKFTFISLLSITIFISCFNNKTKTSKKDLEKFQTKPQSRTVGPGDNLIISSFTPKLLSGKFLVSKDGYIFYPFIGKVKVKNLTFSQINSLIIKKLKDGYFRNPMISVSFQSLGSQMVTIFGRVRKPMSFPYKPKMTFLEAITKAGGFDPSADKEAITVMRKIKGKNYRIRISLKDIVEGVLTNFYLQPGDLIIVTERLM
jgi:protein involved in polysaccharide export with SLBB domain